MRPGKTPKKGHTASAHEHTISETLVEKNCGKILHMLLIIGRHTKRNLSKEAVGAYLESSRLPPQIVVKKPSRSKSRKLHITMPCQRRKPSQRYSLILRAKKRKYPTSRVIADGDGALTSPTRDNTVNKTGPASENDLRSKKRSTLARSA